MNIELKNLKGTTDFLPEKQLIRNRIVDILKANFEKYGYMPLETPILNYLDLLTYKYNSDAEIVNEIYKLSDQAGRDLGLRYDLTVPFCKVIGLNKDMQMPFRRYEIGRVFRNGPVKLGRAREFYQCDIDVVGIDGRLIEIEQMQMVASVFDELGIDVVIKWNNRKLMSGLLEYLQIPQNKIAEVIGLLDRLAKISKKELVDEFEKIDIKEDKVEQILNIFNKNLDEYLTEFKDVDIQILQEGLQEVKEINEYISAVELSEKCLFVPNLARGLSIYTGIVFEFFDKKGRISSSLGGGGRYNKIITDFMDNGQEYPAIGLTFGLEPIYVIMQEELKSSFVDVFIVPMGTEIECLKLANILRENGIKTIIEMKNKKVKKSFEYANKANIKYVIVVGSNEIESGKFSLKNMQSGNQETLSLEEIINILKENN